MRATKVAMMKSTIESLKANRGSGYVRAVSASAVLVPLAAFLAGMDLGNHNETVLRQAA